MWLPVGWETAEEEMRLYLSSGRAAGKKVKKKTKKPIRKRRAKHVEALLRKVKKQLKEFTGTTLDVVLSRRPERVEELTRQEYEAMDPLWTTTMTGEFAGRVPGKCKSMKEREK